MKSFKEYLTESKKVYEFKVKIIGECPKDCSAKIKAALSQYHVNAVSEGKRTPVQMNHSSFPEHKNIEMSIFDVATSYPATSVQIRDLIAHGLGKSISEVQALTTLEAEELVINHQHDQRTGNAIVGTIQDASDNSSLVGDKYNLSFLKELNKEKHQGTQYKGYNDEILADSVPGLAPEYRKTKESTVEKAHRSPVAKRGDDIGKQAIGMK